MRWEIPRRSLADYCQVVYPRYRLARHNLAQIDALESVERGDIKRLIIQMPPRHGKSLQASILFPTWYLGRNPDKRIIATSHTASLSLTFSRQARNIVHTQEYRGVFSGIELSDDSRAVDLWNLKDHLGGYLSAGVGGSVTGRGAHLLLIDDPLKDAEEAGSQTTLDRIWEWYTTTAYTRLEDNAAVIVIMTRWSEDDLTGRLLKAMRDPEADQWHVLSLPALAEESDPLGRNTGEALWPEKYDAQALASIKVNQGSRAFAALYQQRPSPAEGSIFKREWWEHYSVFDRSQASQVIQVWDTAFKVKEQNDYSVCSTWALNGTKVYVLDVFRARISFPELKRKAEDQYAKWQPNAVLIEDKASGQSLIQELQHETMLPVIAVPVDSDKVSRANAVTPFVEAGRVYLPKNAPWVNDWIEEHAAFNAGAHDDQVDTTSMALRRLCGDARAFRSADLAATIDANLELPAWLS